MVLPLGHAVHALAQVEHEVGAAARAEPTHVVPHGHALRLVSQRVDNPGDIIDRPHHTRDVLGRPVLGSRVVQDDDPHAGMGDWSGRGMTPTSAPVIRFHAIWTTSWMSSS